MKALVAVAVLVVAGCSAVASAPSEFSISGVIRLTSSSGDYYSGMPKTCPLTKDGYADLAQGAQVTVYDVDGKAVALGTIGDTAPVESGKASGFGPWIDQCDLSFSVAGVPEGEKIYSIEVAHRGQVRFTRDQLNEPVSLSIG